MSTNIMSGKLRLGALAIAILGLGALLLWQRLEIRRLVTENTDLRNQLEQIASLKDSNGQLAEHLKAAIEMSQANQSELMRLRGQGSRLLQLEQENIGLKSQRQQMERQISELQFASASSGQPQPVLATLKNSATPIPEMPMSDLGTLELADGIETRFDLGGGTNCVVTPKASPDGNLTMQIKAEVANADGTVSELGTSRITARPGQHCSISVGDRMIALAVRLK